MNDQLAQIPGGEIAAPSSTLQAAEESRAVQEVQAAFIMAKKFPRDEFAAQEKIVNACKSTRLAESSEYSYAKGGTQIVGPSIRLAETCARYWGNMRYGIRELSVSPGVSEMQAYCLDLETNNSRELTFQVKHERYTRARGNVALTDPREVYENNANMGARRLRACILAVIPADVVEAAQEQCAKTLAGQSDQPLKERISMMLEAFSEKFTVSQEQIEKRMQKNVSALRESDLVSLRRIFTSLKDGMSSSDEWFEPTQTEKVNGLKERMAKVTGSDPESNGHVATDENGEVIPDPRLEKADEVPPPSDPPKPMKRLGKRARRTNWQIRIDSLVDELVSNGARPMGIQMAIEQVLDESGVADIEDVPKARQEAFCKAVEAKFETAASSEEE